MFRLCRQLCWFSLSGTSPGIRLGLTVNLPLGPKDDFLLRSAYLSSLVHQDFKLPVVFSGRFA
jgi:hypothetical protein